MSDHAAIVRKAHADAMMALAADVHPYTQSSIDAHEQAMDAALDALVAERDDARGFCLAADADAKAAEARVTELEAALRAIQAWDMLNPPDASKVEDFPWLKRLVDAALGKSRT